MKFFVQAVLLPLVVVICAFLFPLGVLFEVSMMRALGYASAASPLPVPFTDARGLQESFAQKTVLVITDVDGNEFTEEVLYSDIPGPHRREVPYAMAIHGWYNNPFIAAQILHYGGCDHLGDIKSHLAGHTITRLTIYVQTLQEPQSITQTIPIICRI